MYTRALALFVGLHGLAHLAGTEETFGKAADGGSVEYLAGGWTVSDPTLLRAFGVVWALLGVALVLTALAVWTRRQAWPDLLALAAGASLTLVTVALWASVIGLLVDVALLAIAIGARGRHHVRVAS